jgi:Ca2+-transporting ATPase
MPSLGLAEPLPGLSESEARLRLASDGPNELRSEQRFTWLTTAWNVLRQPMLLLLVAAATIYLSLGDRVEAMLLVASIVVVIGIELYQEVRTDRALRALRDLSSPRALVIRDGETRRIPGRDVVRGDLIVLEEGDRVPADAALLVSTNLTVDESLLTGESLPVAKRAVEDGGSPGALFSGTLVTSGQGIARVRATGAGTELGKIGTSLESVEVQRTPLQREVDRVAGFLARIALLVCALIALLYGLARSSWVDGLLAGLSAAMSMIPEEFSIVLAAFLALGAARLARDNVLTRRVAAIETLGSATVLCTDKTGTLTLNRMSVELIQAEGAHWSSSESTPMAGEVKEALRFAVLASRPTAVDPMDRAIHALGVQHLAEGDGALGADRLVREYSLRETMAAMVNVWSAESGGDYLLAAKGGSEAILDLCHLEGARRDEVEQRVAAFAGKGFRVLACARGAWPSGQPLPDHRHDFQFELLGLLAFTDPVRPEVPSAIRECQAAGVRVVMITGDHRRTAEHIAGQIGLDCSRTVMTGGDMAGLSDDELRDRMASTSIFVRVTPDQKLRIVRALHSLGEIVAMTGDGVNDAPALKAADIGVAMGGRGTDVAREAAPLIVLDDNFASIVRGIRGGRRIYDNLAKSMAFLLAVHVPIAGLTLLPAVLGWPLILLPAHIVLLEFVIDPTCSLVFDREPEEPDIMQRPPREPSTPLFTASFVNLAVIQGAVVFALTLAVYLMAVASGLGISEARTCTFTTLIIGIIGLILTNRSLTEPIARSFSRRNPLLWWLLAAAPVALLVLLRQPGARGLFHFSEVSGTLLALSAAAGLLAWILLDLTERVALKLRHGGRVSQ